MFAIICVRYTRDQLLVISPARLTPDWPLVLENWTLVFVYPVSTGLGGKNLKKGRPIELITPCVLPSGFQTDLRKSCSVNF